MPPAGWRHIDSITKHPAIKTILFQIARSFSSMWSYLPKNAANMLLLGKHPNKQAPGPGPALGPSPPPFPPGSRGGSSQVASRNQAPTFGEAGRIRAEGKSRDLASTWVMWDLVVGNMPALLVSPISLPIFLCA